MTWLDDCDRIDELEHDRICLKDEVDCLEEENARLTERVKELETEKAAKDVTIAVLKEACKDALWRLEQYNYSAMQPTIERLRTALGHRNQWKHPKL